MHKNYSLFYCYLPKFKEERLIVENQELGFSFMALYDCLYQEGEALGRILRSAQEKAKALLSLNDRSDNFLAIPATLIYNSFDERTFERDSSGRLVEPQFWLARRSALIDDADNLFDEVSIIDDFLDRCIYSKERCSEQDLLEFCGSYRKAIPYTVSLIADLEEYLTGTDCVHTRQETLDMILKYYSFTDVERAKIRKRVDPYIFEPDIFLSTLKECLAECASGAKRYTTFHLYKIESLFDLFSATMQEAAHEKRAVINRCKYCTKWFITNRRINERYCDSVCEENWKQLNSKCRSVYKSIHNYLSEYRTNEELNEFMCDYVDRRNKVYYASDLQELILWLKDFRNNIKTQKHVE